jgi:hypothetical protein
MDEHTHDHGAEPSGGERPSTWRQRLDGIVPACVDQAHVLIVGCGSVGSFMAQELVRAGVRALTLIDPDHVEWPNLTRTVYGHADIGRPKVDALSSHLKGIFPDVQVTAYPQALHDLGEGLVRVLEGVDLIIAAVDQPKANGLLDRYAYALGKPVVFVGLYRGAMGGEVIVTQPGRTPCFHCSTGGVRKVAEDAGLERVDRSVRDYGTSRLVAEVALGSDIHWVSAAAVKIVLSMLASMGGDDSASGLEAVAVSSSPGRLQAFMARQIDEGCNYLMLGMEPDYFLFPSTHAQAIGQYAFQSIWASTTSRPECEVCGLPENRESPF